jgi:hypothetical protein
MSTGSKPKRRRSPQEKKKLSYERDRVNVYGQNDKASRKRIRKFKASSVRALRHKTRKFAEHAAQAGDPERADAALADHRTLKGLRGGNRRRRKFRDFPLALVLDERPVRRVAGADRVRTRNVREGLKMAIQRLSHAEQSGQTQHDLQTRERE